MSEQTIAERSAAANAALQAIANERAEALNEILSSEAHVAAVDALRALYDPTDASYSSLNRSIGNVIQSLDALVIQSASASYVPPVMPSPVFSAPAPSE